MVAGRTSEPRTVASVGTTNASAAITAPANSFNEEDVGRQISGTGIPAAATLLSIASGAAATLSANATATGTITATIGVSGSNLGPLGYGFYGWSPETDAESETYSIAGGASASAPDRLTDRITSAHRQRARG